MCRIRREDAPRWAIRRSRSPDSHSRVTSNHGIIPREAEQHYTTRGVAPRLNKAHGREERRREFMQTAGRRWQDSSLYADPLIPNRENPRARASESNNKRATRIAFTARGRRENRKMGELEENGTAYELRHEAAESGRNDLRCKSKVIINDGNGLWDVVIRRLRRRATGITFPGNVKRGRRSTSRH